MQNLMIDIVRKLAFSLLLSSLWAVSAQAHEVQPAVGDLEHRDGVIELAICLNLEAHMAGIDLDGVLDTDDTDGSAVYDQLRALTPGELGPRVPGLVLNWQTAAMPGPLCAM